MQPLYNPCMLFIETGHRNEIAKEVSPEEKHSPTFVTAAAASAVWA